MKRYKKECHISHEEQAVAYCPDDIMHRQHRMLRDELADTISKSSSITKSEDHDLMATKYTIDIMIDDTNSFMSAIHEIKKTLRDGGMKDEEINFVLSPLFK